MSFSQFDSSRYLSSSMNARWVILKVLFRIHQSFVRNPSVFRLESTSPLFGIHQFLVRNPPIFCSVAVLKLERKTWRLVLGFLARNITCGVLIGWIAGWLAAPNSPQRETRMESYWLRCSRAQARTWTGRNKTCLQVVWKSAAKIRLTRIDNAWNGIGCQERLDCNHFACHARQWLN